MSPRSPVFVEEQSILFTVIVSHDPIGLQALPAEESLIIRNNNQRINQRIQCIEEFDNITVCYQTQVLSH